MKKAITVAIANTKGGSTKSTAAVNLAAAGVKRGKRVLLIDFDQQGTASSMSGAYAQTGINIEDHSAARIIDGVAPSSLVLATEHGYDIIPATAALYFAEDKIKETTFGDGLIARAFGTDQAVFENYDLILCDTQGAATRLQKAVLIMCGQYIIPNLPTQGSIEQLGLVLGTVESINANLFPGLQPIQLRGHFFSSYAPRELVCKKQDEVMTEELGAYHLSGYEIPRTTEFEQAAIMKMPILEYAPDSKASQAYIRLFAQLFPEV